MDGAGRGGVPRNCAGIALPSARSPSGRRSSEPDPWPASHTMLLAAEVGIAWRTNAACCLNVCRRDVQGSRTRAQGHAGHMRLHARSQANSWTVPGRPGTRTETSDRSGMSCHVLGHYTQSKANSDACCKLVPPFGAQVGAYQDMHGSEGGVLTKCGGNFEKIGPTAVVMLRMFSHVHFPWNRG